MHWRLPLLALSFLAGLPACRDVATPESGRAPVAAYDLPEEVGKLAAALTSREEAIESLEWQYTIHSRETLDADPIHRVTARSIRSGEFRLLEEDRVDGGRRVACWDGERGVIVDPSAAVYTVETAFNMSPYVPLASPECFGLTFIGWPLATHVRTPLVPVVNGRMEFQGVSCLDLTIFKKHPDEGGRPLYRWLVDDEDSLLVLRLDYLVADEGQGEWGDADRVVIDGRPWVPESRWVVDAWTRVEGFALPTSGTYEGWYRRTEPQVAFERTEWTMRVQPDSIRVNASYPADQFRIQIPPDATVVHRDPPASQGWKWPWDRGD